MKTRIISLLVVLAFAVVSCQKDEADNMNLTQDVSFGIERVDINLLKDDGDPYECPSNLNAVKAEITINGTVYTVELFIVEDVLYTQAIKLAAGTHTVSQFVLLDADNNFVMAIPEVGSEYADYLSETSLAVPFDIEVGSFTKIEIPVEVLCFLPSEYDKFGFFWFEITEIVIREFCFFGDICANGDPYFPADFANSPYVAHIGGAPTVDMPAIFEVRVFDLQGNPVPDANNNTFSSLGDPTKTVCARFPDKLRTPGEAFKMELWVMVPPAFGYVLFATFDVVENAAGVWNILLNGTPALNEFNAVDFAVGSCSPFSKHVFAYPTAP